MDARANLDYRFAEPRDVRAVLRAYWEWFDAAQRMRTVAQSPFLFRYFHKREMRAGRCRIAVAADREAIVGSASCGSKTTAPTARGSSAPSAWCPPTAGRARRRVRNCYGGLQYANR